MMIHLIMDDDLILVSRENNEYVKNGTVYKICSIKEKKMASYITPQKHRMLHFIIQCMHFSLFKKKARQSNNHLPQRVNNSNVL